VQKQPCHNHHVRIAEHIYADYHDYVSNHEPSIALARVLSLASHAKRLKTRQYRSAGQSSRLRYQECFLTDYAQIIAVLVRDREQRREDAMQG